MTKAEEIVKGLCRKLDRWLTSRIIPCDHFGWETLGYHYPTVGHPVAYGRWHFSEQEREPFYRHNRRLARWATAVRALLKGQDHG